MTTLSPTIELAQALINERSITPEDANCQKIMMTRLQALGFKIERLRFDDVENFWAVYGNEGPIFAFAGHTDVVPTGPEDQWLHPPFDAKLTDDGILHGRGAADMKGSLAAMVTACEAFLSNKPSIKGRIAFLITSDEEGIAINGTVKVIEHLENTGVKITWCLVGEPSSTARVGDIIKNGRRGSLGAELTVLGKQGHVAYPHLAKNPIHLVSPALAELSQTHWDNGNDFFPATSFQVSNIQGGTGATNVIPGDVKIIFNFRFSTELNEKKLRKKTEAILNQYDFEYTINWKLSGEPFLTATGELVSATVQSIKDVTGYEPTLSTAGGTSDGRFIAPTGAQVIELGPINATIHQVNEHIKASDLDVLHHIYHGILEKLLQDS